MYVLGKSNLSIATCWVYVFGQVHALWGMLGVYVEENPNCVGVCWVCVSRKAQTVWDMLGVYVLENLNCVGMLGVYV